MQLRVIHLALLIYVRSNGKVARLHINARLRDYSSKHSVITLLIPYISVQCFRVVKQSSVLNCKRGPFLLTIMQARNLKGKVARNR